ncbi:hypothetical protein [Saccharospirillum salsuginis]|uniref:Porin n=1 Tax=Saccharospirillum salsuginis TaxID=418750 RepID=A0A918K957_9GAMM|nr:hypothetical protein [Saccharospirillum salsuginis]GGX55230.1 hypothetical protein GCM10007392_23600 [Saccharospirillum salsuginis]
MKAIKIASGVAVTALAAAISAQANAAAHGGDTETTFSYTGSMEAIYVIDMENNLFNADAEEAGTVMDMDLDEGDDFDSATAGEAWGLEMGVDVVHGPFSGSLQLRTNDGTVEVDAGDIVITDGAISFGQTGSLVETHEYAYDMGDSNDDFNGNSEGKDVGAAIRYTMDGLAVQVEGENSDADAEGYEIDQTADFGVGAKYSGEADALSYVADFQYRASSLGGEDDAAFIYVGAGATYTMDMVTASVGVNRYTFDGTDANDTAAVEYGFELTATPIDALSVYLKGQDFDATNEVEDPDANNDDSMKLLAGASYTAGMITVTGEYTYTAVEEAGDEFFGEVVYTDGPLSAYGDITLGDLDADESADPQIGAGVSYTKDNGVKYAADYDTQADVENVLKLSAAYAF